MKRLSKIEAGKFSIIFLGSLIIGFGRLFDRFKIAKINMLTFIINITSPFVGALIPRYSFPSTAIVRHFGKIPAIFSVSTLAKIGSSIIHGILVDMIYFFSWFATKNHSMHINNSSRIPSNYGTALSLYAPVPLREPIKISSVNNSILVARQSDKLIRYIGWLGNWMAFHRTLLGHIPTSNRKLLLSHLIIGSLFLPSICFGQGSPGNLPPVFSSNGQPRAGATITICGNPAVSIPCSNLASIFADAALSIPINQTANPLHSDGLGNVPNFYIAPGTYTWTISGTGIVTPQGPYIFVVSCIPVVTCVVATSTNNFSLIQNFLAGISVAGPTSFSGTGNIGTLGLGSTALGAANAWTNTNSFSGVLVNGTQQSTDYKLEVSQSSSPHPSAAPFHITGGGQQNTDTGGWIWSGAADGLQLAAGCVPDPAGSGQYVQKASSGICNQVHFGGGNNIELFGNSGNTVGTLFTATRRMFSSGSQFLFGGGTAASPAIAFQAENPLNGTGLTYTGDPGIMVTLCSAGGSCNGGGGGSGVELLRFIINEIKPAVDNTLGIGDATHRIANVFATTIDCGTAGNITCIQSDGSNNLFIGNANAAAINITPGTTTVINKGISPTSGTGYQAASAAGCATGAAVGSTCTTVVSWTSAFSNTTYRPHCDGVGITSGVPVEGGITATANGSVTFQTVAATAAAAQFSNIICSAFHD